MSETNYDHYKEEILAEQICGSSMCDYIRRTAFKVSSCRDFDCPECKEKFIAWLKSPYEEPPIEIDWSKVPVDTPVYVSDCIKIPDENCIRRYFKGISATGYFTCYDNGATSFSARDSEAVSVWVYCSLARPEDIEKYKKV